MIDELVAGGGDPDDVLRDVVAALVDEGCVWAGILFREGGDLMLGPAAGEQRPDERTTTPVVYDGQEVAQLVVDGCPDAGLPARVAPLIALHCLVGWDTGGIPWEP